MEELLSEILKKVVTDGSRSSSQSPQGDSGGTRPPERPTELATRPNTLEPTGLGPLIMRKRRSKTRTKGTAPQIPTPSGTAKSPDSQTASPTETTRMLDEPATTPSSKTKSKEFLLH